MNKQSAPVEKSANSLLGCIRQCVARKPSEVILPFHLALMRPIWLLFLYCAPQCRRDMNIMDSTTGQKAESHEDDKGLDHLS